MKEVTAAACSEDLVVYYATECEPGTNGQLSEYQIRCLIAMAVQSVVSWIVKLCEGPVKFKQK